MKMKPTKPLLALLAAAAIALCGTACDDTYLYDDDLDDLDVGHDYGVIDDDLDDDLIDRDDDNVLYDYDGPIDDDDDYDDHFRGYRRVHVDDHDDFDDSDDDYLWNVRYTRTRTTVADDYEDRLDDAYDD